MDAKDVADVVNKDTNAVILDVRKTNEYNAEHIKGAENIPLDFVNENMAALDKNKAYFVHCAGGYRSMIFSSILRARGYDNVIDINGGFSELKKIDTMQVEQTSPHTQS
jgi:rhodanese-related sulfurtransferase